MTQQSLHFHLHTDGSLLDGMNDMAHLFKRLKEIGHSVVAVTDHGNMHNALTFYKKAIEEGIKPIVGCELYMFHDHKLQKKRDIETLIAETGDTFIKEESHLVVLAKNFEGYQSLCRLSSIGFSEGFYNRPHIDYGQLLDHKRGLVVIEGHVGTTIAKLIERGEIDRAYDVARKYIRDFGEDFYLEIQNHGLEIEKVVTPVVIQMAKDLGVTLVASNDSHYTRKEDAEAHRVLFANGIGKTYGEFMSGPYEGFTTCEEFYIKSDDEMFEAMLPYGAEAKQAVLNTMELSNKCDLNIPHIEYEGSFINAKGKVEHKWKTKEYFFPSFNIPAPYLDANAYISFLAREGLEERKDKEELYNIGFGISSYEDYKERLEFELGVITKMGFPTYFLILWDVLKFCKEKDIPVGKGRGSGAGSLVLYSLSITDVDPIQYNLLFERFLSVDRISLPDVDLDFCMARIEEVIDYVKEKYGVEYVAKIGTFGTLGAKAVLKDVARVLEYPFDKINILTKIITDISISIDKAMVKYKDIQEAYDSDPAFKKVVDIAKRLEGLQRHASKHAAGIIISPFPLTDIIPLKGDVTNYVSQYAMGELELLGLVKMDFLKLRTLTIIKDSLNSIKRNTGKTINIDRIDFNDKKVFEEFQKGNSTSIFQFESPGMQALLKGMKPKSIDDLAAANALYRPGPLDMKVEDPHSPHFGKTMVDVYVSRASGESEVEYDHPLLEEVLKDTYGVFVFQEQIMKSSVVLAGHTKGESDNLRKVVAKKLEDKMPVEKEKYVNGCLNNSLFVENCGEKDAREIAENIWKQIETFGRYGFNAAHSYSYAILAFQSMYLKVYYPAHFMAAVLTSWMGKKISLIVPYLNESRKVGISILPPDINQSSNKFEVSKDGLGIHFGLNAVKGVGEKAVINILEVKQNHEIKILVDFITMTNSSVNKTVVASLIKCGAFDFLGESRRGLIKMAEDLIELQSKVKQKIAANKKRKTPLSDISHFYNVLYDYELERIEEFDLSSLCEMERELTGFYMKYHPLDGLIDYIQSKSTFSSQEINKGIKLERVIKSDAMSDDPFISEVFDFNIDDEDIDDDDLYQPLPIGQTIITGGVIKSLNEIVIKKGRSAGKTMVSFVLEDAHQGEIKCTAFAETYSKFKAAVYEGNIIFIQGKLDYYMGSAQVNVDKISEISRDTASQYTNRKYLEDIISELTDISGSIDFIEETIALLDNDYDLVSEMCNELINLYEKRDELRAKQGEVAV